MTTEEISRHIEPGSHDQPVLQLLRQADLVKFADAIPTPAAKEQDLQVVRNYIHRTAPLPAEDTDIRQISDGVS